MSKRIIATGVSGLVGKTLCKELLQKGYELVVVTRDTTATKTILLGASKYITWTETEQLEAAIDGAYGIINLASTPLMAKRWTKEFKKLLFASRINTVKSLVNAIKKARVKPKVFISASAVGYYGTTPRSRAYVETDSPGDNFLAQLCVAWEKEAQDAKKYGTRLVSMRTAIILDQHEGALPRMIPPFYYYMGGPIGSGRQWFPWIHIKDEVGIIIFALEHEKVSGAINAVSPETVTNKEFSTVLGQVLHKPSLIPVPPFILRLAFGEAAMVLTTGVNVSSQKIIDLGYTFQYPQLKNALESILK